MLGDSPMRQCRAISAVLTTAIVLAAGLVCGPDACAQAPKQEMQKLSATLGDAKREDPQARALFDEVAKAYRSLKSYSDQGNFTVAMKIGGRLQKHELPLKLTLVRPNKVDFDGGPVRIKSDGATMTTTVVPLKRYTTSPAPPKIGFETFSEGPSGAVLFGGPSGPPMFVLLNLLTGADASAAVGLLGGSLQAAPADPRAAAPNAGAKMSAILVDLPAGQPDILLTIDPATKLLSAIDMQVGPELLAQAGGPALAVERVERFGWSSGPISTAVAPDRSFAFEAPKDYAKVDDLLKRDENGPKASKIGKPAPEFTLTVLDGPAKTRTITKAELAGKVVVIDFWATWCEPCMKELPEIQTVIENYAGSKKGLVIVAVSQDDEPAELSAVRKRVEKTLADKQMKLENGAVGLVALDPSKSVGGAFEIEGYPTLVILDGKGVVQAVHVGFDSKANEPFSTTLSKEIDTLLEGQSLLAPRDNAAQPAAKKEAKTPE
jgi:thiol-disulfide isomerase/thioredoxin